MAASRKKIAGQNPILAAGGIVLRRRKKPLFAVVQLSQQRTWALPKGKLRKNETVQAAAKREAIEETGHDVVVHEYLGQIAYTSGGRPKIAKFWRMEARGKPGELMPDVRSVRWLPLDQAVERLSKPRERKFLQKVGPKVLKAATRAPEAQPVKPAGFLTLIRKAIARFRGR